MERQGSSGDAPTWTFLDPPEPERTMWPTIQRARRRLSGGAAVSVDPPSPTPSSVAPVPPADPAFEDLVIVLRGVEVDRLCQALQRCLGSAVERPDTPDRFERALSLFLARSGEPGRPRVLRRPAGVSTPESWEIHLEGVDHAVGEAVREAGRTGRFA